VENQEIQNAEAENAELNDVAPVYANNVRFEMTAWDLRLLFGQLMPSSEGQGQVEWHTDVTVPWAQAKLMHLFLGINLTLYERENGKISIPLAVLPAAMAAPPPGVDASNPEAIETFNPRAKHDQSLPRGTAAGELIAGVLLT
jgi:hypothetical protein